MKHELFHGMVTAPLLGGLLFLAIGNNIKHFRVGEENYKAIKSRDSYEWQRDMRYLLDRESSRWTNGDVVSDKIGDGIEYIRGKQRQTFDRHMDEMFNSHSTIEHMNGRDLEILRFAQAFVGAGYTGLGMSLIGSIAYFLLRKRK